MKWIWRFIRLILVLFIGILLLGGSKTPATSLERIRTHTRGIEFDYVSWVIDAFSIKITQLALGTVYYLPEEQHPGFKMEYLDLVRSIQRLEGQLRDIYSDPSISDPEMASEEVRARLNELNAHRRLMAPVSEAIMQRQVAGVATEMGLTYAGQALPPVLYKTTPLPMALIVSPRNIIRVEHNVSLVPELPVSDQSRLEDTIDATLDVSTLVIPIGGVGLYPTMVMETSDIVWLSEIVAHEWIHNYLTLRPLGMSYLSGREQQIMNETAATIAGKEMGLALVSKHYPEFLPPPPPPDEGPRPVPPTTPPDPQEFNFRAEMHTTRMRVDELLAAGQVEEAEDYMEQRRSFFWDNGYRLRKLNQAYFAFYGSYADTPQGAAGEDPVGAAVRTLRSQSPSLAQFINQIAWMTSFDQLEAAVQRGEQQARQ
jgi:hypothetical protein